jgi:hypothetical protein
MTYYLNFLFNNQTHKTSGGYYLNHDSLMAVNEEARKRLAFYFIAEQTPEKLDQTDFDTYKQIRYYLFNQEQVINIIKYLLTSLLLEH